MHSPRSFRSWRGASIGSPTARSAGALPLHPAGAGRRLKNARCVDARDVQSARRTAFIKVAEPPPRGPIPGIGVHITLAALYDVAVGVVSPSPCAGVSAESVPVATHSARLLAWLERVEKGEAAFASRDDDVVEAAHLGHLFHELGMVKAKESPLPDRRRTVPEPGKTAPGTRSYRS